MDLRCDTSLWSYCRMDTTLADFAIFWQKGFGDNLANPPQLEGHDMSIDLANLKEKLQRFYVFFRDTLKFVKPGSKADKYRMMIMLNYSLEGTAYGGDYDTTIGALWIAPGRVKDKKLNCIAHELGHSFQSQITSDGEGDGWGGSGFFEMASQWMLWQVNPDWVTDENYHLEAFKKLTHKAFLHLDNIYHSPYIIEYWAEKHGLESIAQLFRDGKIGEDPAMTYMRTNNLSQKAFNDEMFDASCHIVNFDFSHAYKETRPYAATFCNKLDSIDGWLCSTKEETPEEYGFNVIPLPVKEKLMIEFEGLPDSITSDEGWRYGIVEVDKAGKAHYGKMQSAGKGKVVYKPTATDSKVFLVVMGAPKKHIMNPYPDENGQYPAPFSKYPYRIRLK